MTKKKKKKSKYSLSPKPTSTYTGYTALIRQVEINKYLIYLNMTGNICYNFPHFQLKYLIYSIILTYFLYQQFFFQFWEISEVTIFWNFWEDIQQFLTLLSSLKKNIFNKYYSSVMLANVSTRTYSVSCHYCGYCKSASFPKKKRKVQWLL